MATITFKIRPGTNNAGSVYLIFSFGRGNELRYSTRWRIEDANNWNYQKQRIKVVVTEPRASSINKRINELEVFFQEKYLELKDSRIEISKQVLKNELDIYFKRKRVINSTSVYRPFLDCFKWYYEHFSKHPLPSTKKPLSNGTVKSYKTCHNILEQFDQQIYALNYDRINLDFYYTFLEYLWDKEYSNNYISRHIKMIKTIMNYAYEKKFHNNLDFKSKAFSKIEESIDHIYLSTEELDAIRSLKLNDKMGVARDWFIIAANTGLRVSDYVNLKMENLKEIGNRKVLKVLTKKTGKTVYIPLKSDVLEIIKSYKHSFPPKMPEQTVNKLIKNIGRMAGIKDLVTIERTIGGKKVIEQKPKYAMITNHSARRSFCTNAYKAGLPVTDIMAISGHTTERNFYSYLKLSDFERLEKISKHPFFN